MEMEQPAFDGDELRDNLIFNPFRELTGEHADRLLDDLEKRLLAFEKRKRALRPVDAHARRRTLSVLIANLVTAAYNKVKPDRFLAMSFGRSSYSPNGLYGGLSYTTATLARDAFRAAGWVEVANGFNRFDYIADRFGMLTRVRATSALVDYLSGHSIKWRAIRTTSHEPIRPRGARQDISPEPADVDASRQVIAATNALLSAASIVLPQNCWDAIRRQRRQTEGADREEWPHEGDLAAKTIYRSFSGSWHQGGRLYGGWWQNVPSQLRAAITIDGSAVCELDYGQLHPRILYARLGKAPPQDLYALAGFDRELNKETFMRLLNGKTLDIKKPKAYPLPKGVSFIEYLNDYLMKIGEISQWLGKGEGVKLQREDSELAISVLDQLNEMNIVALPVHDSFIVMKENRHSLHKAMRECFIAAYGVEPEIR